ncbi:hypothetical protein GCM10007049_38630 [Echinicola pacifica]|uniref:Anti-sigma K factor RskA C-terminal domain-containing protein n=1 Tax=Echinicola pacifica TaxID=346377 RepID=A0A918QCJ7_9BACT|nr:anti-sigma factor [Echinicola pacifica]GGZ41584.1 hypothetical protein GCM10007049_38630 [Echinicola pacifica]
MDIQSYIASGKLELFVLGELSDREQEEVLSLAQQYPEIQQELDDIQEAMMTFDMKSGLAPSLDTKNKIFDSLEEDLQEKPIINSPKQTTKVTSAPMAKEVAINASGWKTFAVAASVVAVLASAAAIYFAGKFYDVEERFTALLQERNILSEDLEINQAKYQELDTQMETFLAGNYSRIPMKGEPFEIQKEARVDVFWDKESQQVFVSVNQLASLEEDQDYQLWAIGDDGPVGIGIVKPGQKLTFQQMSAAASAGAFAITIEPKGGSKSPTLEKLVVLGEVT